jgi:hypothetical protein
MKHLSEEELVERYYGGEGTEAAQHFDTCSECARAFAALGSDLADLKSEDPPPRDAAYGRQVWAAVSNLLPTYPTRRRPPFRSGLWLGLSAATACILLVSAAFYAGRLWEHRQQPRPTVAHTPSAPQQRVIVVVLSDHLDRSERLLVELKHADADDAQALSPLSDEARSLLVANGKCRQEAEANGDPALTKALDHLNELLTGLANQPGGLNADAISRLQAQMDKDGLLFEVRVLRSRIPSHHAAADLHLKGGIA